MKRFICTAVAAVLMFSLSACGGEKKSERSKTVFDGVKVQDGCYFDEEGVMHVDTEKLDYSAGINITWSYDEESKTLNFEGAGLLTDAEHFAPYKSFAENVVISDDVTEICASAFEGFSVLENIKMPSTVTVIGDYAFKNCSMIKEVYLSENISMIGREAFAGCSLLEGIEIPKNDVLFELKNNIFADCGQMKMAVIPPTVTYIAPGVFENCPNLAIYGDENSFAYDYAMTEGLFFQTYTFE